MPEKIKAQIGILLLMRKKKDNCYQEFFIFSSGCVGMEPKNKNLLNC